MAHDHHATGIIAPSEDDFTVGDRVDILPGCVAF
jgi:hypothetical protein